MALMLAATAATLYVSTFVSFRVFTLYCIVESRERLVLIYVSNSVMFIAGHDTAGLEVRICGLLWTATNGDGAQC